MTLAHYDSQRQLYKLISRWLPALCMALAMLPFAGVAADAPVAACDAAESDHGPVQSRMFAERTLNLIEVVQRGEAEWQALREAAICGDPQARDYLESQVDAGSAGLYSLAALIAAGGRDVTELAAAIGRAGLNSNESSNLLTIAYGWMVGVRAQMLPSRAVAETEWAVRSKDKQLAQAGWEMRAVFQHPEAVEIRAQRLTDCAAGIIPGINAFDGCVESNERFTASTSTLVQRWGSASPKEREWLTAWAQPNKASQKFLLEQLLNEPPDVQQAILVNALTARSGSGELAIKGALMLLQQALDEPSRRPDAVRIDFTTDYAEGDFGLRAYAERYPSVFQSAFDELVTYPDATELMKQLAALDHPWLATQAGIWLMRHDVGDAGRHGLRYTLEEDALPSAHILRKLAPPIYNGELPASMRALFADVLDRGAMGKWGALAVVDLEPMLSDPAVAAGVVQRITNLPAQIEELAGQFSPNSELRLQFDAVPGLGDELQAGEWALKALARTNPAAVDACIDSYAQASNDVWRAFALNMAKISGRDERAHALALTLVNSKWPAIAEMASKIMDITPAD